MVKTAIQLAMKYSSTQILASFFPVIIVVGKVFHTPVPLAAAKALLVKPSSPI